MDKIKITVLDNRKGNINHFILPDNMYELEQCWDHSILLGINSIKQGIVGKCDICHQSVMFDKDGHII